MEKHEIVTSAIRSYFNSLYNRELSYSSISLYNECKLKFILHYLLPLDASNETPGTNLGNAYHGIMESLVKMHANSGEVINVYGVINEYLSQFPENKFNDTDINKILLAVNETYSYISKNFILDSEDNAERKFLVKGKVRGMVDLFTDDGDRFYIIDYKSSSFLIDDDSAKLQLMTYFYGLYYSDDKFKEYIDSGSGTVGIILAPFLSSKVEHSRFVFYKEDLSEVELHISKVQEFLNSIHDKYKDHEEVEDILMSLVGEKHLSSGVGCKFCRHKNLCPFGFSIDLLKSKLDNLGEDTVDDMAMDEMLSNYKVISSIIDNASDIKSQLRANIQTYMRENSLNKYKSPSGITARFNKRLKHKVYVPPRVVFDTLGEASLQFMETSMKKLMKSPMMKKKLSDIIYYTTSLSNSGNLVIK